MKNTIVAIKEKRSVPEENRTNLKNFNRIKKDILKSLESGKKTIPELKAELNLSEDVITYYLMTLLKYKFLVAAEMDDNDEYFFYDLNKLK